MRHAKQLIYGVIYLIILSGAAAGFYYLYLRPAPPPCLTCNEPQTAPLTAGNVYALPLVSTTTAGHVSFVAEVRNPNPDWGAGNFTYTFHAFAADGTDLGDFSGSSYIYPGEIKYVALPNQAVAGAPATTTLEISAPEWAAASGFVKPDVTAAVVRTDRGQILAVTGTVANNSALTVRADLVALFYNSEGNLVGASTGALTGLAPKATGQFTIFHPNLPNIAPDRTQVYAYAYVLQ